MELTRHKRGALDSSFTNHYPTLATLYIADDDASGILTIRLFEIGLMYTHILGIFSINAPNSLSRVKFGQTSADSWC